MTRAQIAMRYAAFAVIAILANLGAQRIVLALLDTQGELAAAIFVGTGVGLVVKYALDKKWIFHYASSGLAAHGKLFSNSTAGLFSRLPIGRGEHAPVRLGPVSNC